MHEDEDGALFGLAWSRFWQPLHVGLAADSGGGMFGPSFMAAAVHLGANHRIGRLRGLASAEAGMRRTTFTCFPLFADGDPCHHAYASGFIGARGELNLEGSRWGVGLWFSVQRDHDRSAFDRWVFGGNYVQLGLQVSLGLPRPREQPLAAASSLPDRPAPRPPASADLVALRRKCLPWTSAYWREYDESRRADLRARMPPACRTLIERARRPPG